MTINIRRLESSDIVADGSWCTENLTHDFDRVRAAPPIAATTFVATRSTIYDNMKATARSCVEAAQELIQKRFSGSMTLWLFVADGPWSVANRILRYKRLWSRFTTLTNADISARKSDDVEFSLGQWIRYAGMLEVRSKGFENAIELTRTEQSHALIYSGRSSIADEFAIREVFSAAFPPYGDMPATCIDWPLLATVICPYGDILMRVSGHFDDLECSADLFHMPSFNAPV